MTKRIALIILLASVVSIATHGQNSITLSMPVIYSKVEVPNNWSPPTAINRKDQFTGSSLGYGFNLNYSFKPVFLKNQNIRLMIGAGYFKQKFDIERPFNYNSPIYIIFYTDYYSYECFQGLLGLTYSYALNQVYVLEGNLSYSWLHSFQQEYTPTYSAGTEFFTQVDHKQINFGKLLLLSIGARRDFGSRISLKMNLLIPLYTRWRNDAIFGDDPAEFSKPSFSLGSSIGVSYRFKWMQ